MVAFKNIFIAKNNSFSGVASFEVFAEM